MLDALILTELKASKFENQQLDPKQFAEWRKSVQIETERIKKAFINVVFSIKKERQVEIYIQQHQQELIRLTDQLLSYFSPEETVSMYDISRERNRINLYKHIYMNLEELLTYIEKYFSKYFSLKAKVPDSYKFIAMRDFQERIPGIEKRLKEKEVNTKLIPIILFPLKEFTQGKIKKDISFRKLIYFKTLLREICDLSHRDEYGDALGRRITCNLTYLNFNSYRYFNFCTEYIKQEYQSEDTLCGQIEKLAWHAKNINQAQLKPGFAYKPKQKNLKDSLIEWIDEEICFLEKRQQLTLNISMDKYENLPKDFKINTSLSVSQLAYLTRVFIESGVMKNRNHREVLKFLAQFTRTKRAENISAESLRTKYYNVEDGTKETVKDVLIGMLNHVRKE